MIKMVKNPLEADAVTHSGTFHADEVLATVILSKVFGYITVCRTNKVPEESRGVVYDIGMGKFDHHQRGGNGVRENGVPYAAAGLIWKEFGARLVAKTCNPSYVWDQVDRCLIQGVDAYDNGKMPKAKYPVQAMNFSQSVSSFNPTQDSNLPTDECFEKAVDFAELVFDNVFENSISKAKAQAIVEEAVETAEDNIMVLKQFVPWQELIFSSKNEKATKILFVVFPSNRNGYNWQCVPDKFGSFGQRKSVPDSWKGLQGLELQKATGVKTAIFCHPAGFIGGAETLEDAIKMAQIAVES